MILSDRVLGSFTDLVIPGACRGIRHGWMFRLGPRPLLELLVKSNAHEV